MHQLVLDGPRRKARNKWRKTIKKKMNCCRSRCYSSLSLIACGCRYPKLSSSSQFYFLTSSSRLYHRYRFSTALTAISSRCCPIPRSLFFTGNSLIIRMEQYWSGTSINKNKGMVDHLKSYGVIKSKKVAEVLESIDRALFVPEGTPAYVDSPMQIGYNATISAPHMHATCLQLLENHLKPGMHALDIGSGTGYLTACFALMVGKEGHAVGVEHIPELVASSIKNIEKSVVAPLMKEGSLSVHVGDGRKGWGEFAPYDCIHVGAAAPEIPPALVEQLKPGGRLVIPVGNIYQDLQVVDKNMDGTLTIHSETAVRYVPLTSRDAQLRGY